MNSEPTPAVLSSNKQLPRYTSYPTAPHFSELSPDEYNSWLKNISPEESISLYLHVPYCKKLCWFCGCHTKITEKYEPVSHYTSLLMKEMGLLSKHIGRKQRVSHVHWGGGSPSYMKPMDFSASMAELHKQFDIPSDASMAIEIDPRNVSEANVAAYALSGINRVSIGVQDFDAEVQKAINRIQPYHVVMDLVAQCRNYGINDINFDLIYGLPKQTEESLQRTMELTVTLKPNRISLFGYAHVPWKKKNIRLIDVESLPNEKQRIKLFNIARKILLDAGYISIGLDHFALKDDSMSKALANNTLHRNFQGYTTDGATTLLGLGASAIGNLREGYAQNTLSIEAYDAAINSGNLPIARGFILSEDDRLRRCIIENLMCYLEVDVEPIARAHGKSVSELSPSLAALEYMQHDGLITLKGTSVRVNPELPQAVRLACAAFDTYYRSGTQQHSQVA